MRMGMQGVTDGLERREGRRAEGRVVSGICF